MCTLKTLTFLAATLLAAACGPLEPAESAGPAGIDHQAAALTDAPDLVLQSQTAQDVAGGVQMTVVLANIGTQTAGYMTYAFMQTLVNQPKPCYLAAWAPTSYGGLPYTSTIVAGGTKTFTITLAGWTRAKLQECGGDWKVQVDATNQVAESDENNTFYVPN